jgi:serine protease AprX
MWRSGPRLPAVPFVYDRFFDVCGEKFFMNQFVSQKSIVSGTRVMLRFAFAAALLPLSGISIAGTRAKYIDVIVATRHPMTQKEELSLKGYGAFIYRHLPLIRSVAVRVPALRYPEFSRQPFISHLSPDAVVRKTDAFTISASGANTAWTQYGLSGKGIGIAVIDSGIRASADFDTRVVASVNLSPDSTTADDLCGHGTQVAGILAGNGSNSTGPKYTQTYFGVAPQASLVNIRVLDSQGNGSVSQVVAGISWAILNRLFYNIRVINLSLGHPVGESYTTDPLCQACEIAWKTGMTVVVAAGNDGRISDTQTAGADNDGYGTAYGTITAPGNDPYVITVGAMKQMDASRVDDTIASYSSRGPSRLDFVAKPDLVAPGNLITSVLSYGSSLYQEYSSIGGVPWSAYMANPPAGLSTNYFTMSGTSMSAPVVTAAAALLLQKNPLLSPDTIKARLMLSADKWTGPTGSADIFTYGAGFLDIPAAIANPAFTLGYAMSPTAAHQSNGNVTINPIGSLLSIITGLGLLDLGSLSGERVMWGEGAFSSENTVASNRVMWGEGFWTDSSTYPENTTSANWIHAPDRAIVDKPTNSVSHR